MKNKHKHIGSSFDDFLQKEGIYEEVNSYAVKEILAFMIQEEMKKKKLTKTELAKLLGTSRSSLDRILNPQNHSITLLTIEKIANIFDKKVKISFA